MDDVVARARALIGVKFRPQGRSPEAGLDCIGVVAMVFGLAAVRSDYRLRFSARQELNGEFTACGFRPIEVTKADVGDVLVVEAGHRQLHVVVLTRDGYLHADAGLRRVVEVPGAVAWPVVAAWRARPGTEGEPHLRLARRRPEPAHPQAGEG